MKTRPRVNRPLIWPTGAFACIVVAVSVTILASSASAQDPGAAHTSDAILARKTVMDTLSEKIDSIESMIAAGKIDLESSHANAIDISIYLMAFPHMFAPAANQWKAGADRDPVTDTSASPDVWITFEDFYRQATAASKSAFAASRAQNDNELKSAIGQLRAGCNVCHAAYLKTD
jgi:cytochrome c556